MCDAFIVDLNHKVLRVPLAAEQIGARQPFARLGGGARSGRKLYARNRPARILDEKGAGERILCDRLGKNQRPARQVRTKAAWSDDRFGNPPFTFAKHLSALLR